MRALLMPFARVIAAYPTVAKPVMALAIMATGWVLIPMIVHNYGHLGFAIMMVVIFAFGFWLDKHTKPDQG
jgi:hypothetical protein